MVKLPNQFSDLQDLADIFAIADDIDRDRVESESSAQQKRDLVSRVWPKLNLINQWWIPMTMRKRICWEGSLKLLAK